MVTKKRTPVHEHHSFALFLLFCMIAVIGTAAVVLQARTSADLTSATTATTYTHYSSCTDYGNYIILENDAGWRLVKKDLCTGANNKFLKRVACVEDRNYDYYTYTYAGLAYCESGASCVYDKNRAAYCPE
jgi:hypothetical protein